MVENKTILRMKTLKIYLLLLGLCMGLQLADAKGNDVSFYMDKGIEAMEAGDYVVAHDMFKKELEENPKNGIAYTMMTIVAYNLDEHKLVKEYAEKSLTLLSKKETEFRVLAYTYLSMMALEDKDTVKCLSYVDESLKMKLNSKQAATIYAYKAEIFYETNKENEARDLYKKVMSLDKTNASAYYGLAKCDMGKKDYQSALNYLNQGVQYDPYAAKFYRMRAKAYLLLNNTEDASKNLITYVYLREDIDNITSICLDYGNDELFQKMLPLAKINCNKFPEKRVWYDLVAFLYVSRKEYTKAIENCFEEAKIDLTSNLARKISSYSLMSGNNKYAKLYADMTVILGDGDEYTVRNKANVLTEIGDYKQAIQILDSLIAKNEKDTFAYSLRAYAKYTKKDYKGAYDDYSKAIELMPDHYEFYERRATIDKLLGDAEKSKADMLKYVNSVKDKEKISSSCYFYLNEPEKAKKRLLEELDKTHSLRSGDDYYNAACLYSLLGEKQTAIDYLKKAVDNGFLLLEHVNFDTDLANIRDTKEYKDITNQIRIKRDEKVKKQEEVYKKGFEMRADGIYSLSESKMQFYFRDKPCEYVGGDEALTDYVEKNLIYSKEAMGSNNRIQINVYFLVNEDGSVSDVYVRNNINSTLSNSAINMIKNMPSWIPAEYKGKKVKERCYIPIVFTK